jgi:hypothetical protein
MFFQKSPWYENPQWWSAIATFFVAIIALILAIFQDWLRSLFQKPELQMGIKKEAPDCYKAIFRNPQTGEYLHDCYYFRFKVDNTGNYQMEDAEIMIIEIEERLLDGKYHKRTDFLPMNFVWSYYRTLTMPKIQPKLFKHCDLGHIMKAEDANLENFGKTKSSNIVLILDVVRPTFIGAHILEPGDYNIKIKFAANNLKPELKIYNVVIKDEWTENEEEMLKRNVSIREMAA